MFKGFDIKYPEYEVITPQTNMSYNVRSLNVQEEERLKGSLLTPVKVNEHLNKCIWDSLSKKPEEIKTYDDFIKKTTLKDRDALLYGLYHITYEEIRNYDVLCGVCRKQYPVTVQASSTFNINPYPGNDILNKVATVELPISKNVTTFIKQPTLFDELQHFKSGGISANNMDLLMETLIITKFQYQPNEGDTVIYSDREDIVDAYRTLPARDKRSIYKDFREKFGKYGIVLKMQSKCIHCSEVEEIDIDLVENFFRMVHSI
ncbi:MAG: hypothetical protein ACFFG0_02050 [Candidatus Thorarchaeota archaeon]